MYIALDGYGRRIHIDNANRKEKYYCPGCGAQMDTRFGDIRRHCFAHKRKSSECTDSWIREKTYDTDSSWHHDWQNIFPEDNQEVYLTFGEVRHRGDIVSGKTVIEFQHSPLSPKGFNKRTNFYHNCECKVIWVFDLLDDYKVGKIREAEENVYLWNSSRRALDYLNQPTGQVELFLQIEEDKLLKVKKLTGMHYENVKIQSDYSKDEFLDYVGLKDGKMAPPDLSSIDMDPAYQDFKDKYDISLNRQQERAVQAIEGSVLLLAVPGSGKTTTLATRIGYMILCKNVDPSSILALTYTNKGADEMRQRLDKKFGEDFSKKLKICTINSLCNGILKQSGYNKMVPDAGKVKNLLMDIYKRINGEYALETDVIDMESEISYIKNMMVSDDEISQYNWNTDGLERIYHEYVSTFERNGWIDYDDQLIHALRILREDDSLLSLYRNTYRYISVDEAQDTSRIQHEIIKLIAGDNNIFMVGDEDQSIYGYRGAYPKALLEFSDHYKNPFVLKMETNYRSLKQIVAKSNAFIDNNKNRIEKEMVASRKDEGIVDVIDCESRSDQFAKLSQICEAEDGEIAIIYRNNDTAIPLIDLLERKGISYSINKMNETFFSGHIINDIKDILNFAHDQENTQLFMKIYYKFSLMIKKDRAEYACNYSRIRGTKLLDEFVEQCKYTKGDKLAQSRAARFVCDIRSLVSMAPAQAIEMISMMGYRQHAMERGYGAEKIELVKTLAEQEKTIPDFLKRLVDLQSIVEKKRNDKNPNRITLSTIHSCKGMEFEKVYIVDAVDRILPSYKSKFHDTNERRLTS